MSNPTALSEAVPRDLIAWTDGRALVATGSPYGAVDYGGVHYEIGQANNALIFPGLGLGVIAARAPGDRRDAAHRRPRGRGPGGHLGSRRSALPRVADLRETSVAVAAAVAREAEAEGVGSAALSSDLSSQVRALMWEPLYRPVKAA
jgi:malate dehydrogenase (oxaloacetate-decarboxylating)